MVAQGATPGQITVYLWPAGQGRIDLAQNGANVATCDFRTVIDTSSKCAVDVAAGVPVTLTATPIPKADATLNDVQTAKVPDYPVDDSTFVRWTVFGCDGTGPCTYTPEDEDWVGAIFTPLELEVGVVGNGIVVDATDADRLSCDNTWASRTRSRRATASTRQTRRSCSRQRRDWVTPGPRRGRTGVPRRRATA